MPKNINLDQVAKDATELKSQLSAMMAVYKRKIKNLNVVDSFADIFIYIVSALSKNTNSDSDVEASLEPKQSDELIFDEILSIVKSNLEKSLQEIAPLRVKLKTQVEEMTNIIQRLKTD